MNFSIEVRLAGNRYNDHNFDCDAVKLLPGEYYVTNTPMLMVTVLGSCVAACIRDRKTGIGGMNHFMLPDGGASPGSQNSASMRYGVYAMQVLIGQLLEAGAQRSNLEAKLFGGGDVLRGFTSVNVGEKNSRFARDFLLAEDIRIVAENMGDTYSRKVYFFPETGKVLIKKLKQLNNYTLVKREQDYAQRLKIYTVDDELELF
jgi:chemotaxis protein CheD